MTRAGRALVTLLAAAAPTAHMGGATAFAEHPNHFILLIDDSKTMSNVKTSIAPVIVRSLFEARPDGPPTFRPGTDRLSAVFFAVHTMQRGCNGEKELSNLSSRGLFDWVPVRQSALTRDGVRAFLDKELQRECRLFGSWGAINTAPMIVLPFARQRLAEPVARDGVGTGPLYERTFIILVSDGIYNSTSAAGELLMYARKGFHGTAEAHALSARVSALLALSSPPGWMLGHGSHFVQTLEVRPQTRPDGNVSFPSVMHVDRAAISTSRVRLVPDRDTIRLEATTPSDDRTGFEPVSLRLSFSAAGGGPWALGQRKAPEQLELDLRRCAAPMCTREKDGSVSVSILHAAFGDVVTDATSELPDGTVRLRAGYRLIAQTSNEVIYDRAFVEVPPASRPEAVIEAKMVPPLQVERTALSPFAVLIDNRELASRHRPGDKELTPAVARERIVAEREASTRWKLGAAAAGIVATVALLVWLGGRRRFKPRLEWHPAGEIVLDFNTPEPQPGQGPPPPVLVGTIRIVNEAPQPLLGRLFESEPRVPASMTLVPPDMAALGLVCGPGAVLGFMEKGTSALRLTASLDASDGREAFVFLAVSQVEDVLAATPAHADPSWGAVATAEIRMALRGSGVLSWPAEFRLRAVPEAARPPLVRFVPVGGKARPEVEFRRGNEPRLGAFEFSSCADHAFAVPFREDYEVRFQRGADALGGAAGRLERGHIEVPPGSGRGRHAVAVPVSLACDGSLVRNPEPSADDYVVTLSGRCAEASLRGPHAFRVLRDTTRADVVLHVSHAGASYEAFWSSDRPHLQALDGTAAPLASSAGRIRLRDDEVRFERESAVTHRLLGLEIGNSGTDGRGTVSLLLELELTLDVPEALNLARGYALGDLVRIEHGGQPRGTSEKIVVSEGDRTVRAIVFDPRGVARVPGGRVPAGACRVSVTMRFDVTTDQQGRFRREVTFELPFTVEELPGSSWLCLDLGTSAIAVTVGTGSKGQLKAVPLQELPLVDTKADGKPTTLATWDKANSEAGAKNLLPSVVAFDGDHRRGQPGGRPGTPLGAGSMAICEPGFVSLPAVRSQTRTRPGRVVASVKTWLSRQSSDLFLADPITCTDRTGVTRERSALPLDEALEGVLAALVEGYLHPRYGARQVVLTHPNAFTEFHRARLRGAALRAMGTRLGIPLEERIHLMSESDAVAYYYCHRQRTGHERPRRSRERLLVYDFGSGTVDLSLVDVEWLLNPLLPQKWTVLGRLGVPIAGDYIDESLARLVDECLALLPGIEYQFRIVTENADPERPDEHINAVEDVRAALRTAKHAWDGASRFECVVGWTNDPDHSLVRVKEAPEQPPADDAAPGVWVAPGREVRISLPGAMVLAALHEFREFITGPLVQELLDAADCGAKDVDTVIVSGRGALFPGIRQGVWDMFPTARKPKLDVQEMKEAVAIGAIARYELGTDLEYHDEARVGRLAVLHDGDRQVITDERWASPQLLLGSYFRFVQVNCRNPDPTRDMATLRRSFYVPLSDGVITRSTVLKGNQTVTISLDPGPGGTFGVALTNTATGHTYHAQLKRGDAPPTGAGGLLLMPLSKP